MTGYEKKLVQHQDTLTEPNRTGPDRNETLRYPDTLTSSGFPSVAATQELSFLRKSSEKRLPAKLVWTSTKGIVGPLVLLVLEQKLQESWREATRSDTVDFLLMWRQNTRVWVPINRIYCTKSVEFKMSVFIVYEEYLTTAWHHGPRSCCCWCCCVAVIVLFCWDFILKGMAGSTADWTVKRFRFCLVSETTERPPLVIRLTLVTTTKRNMVFFLTFTMCKLLR